MSDENAPLPSLRLKPRIRPEAVSTPPPPSIVLAKTPMETLSSANSADAPPTLPPPPGQSPAANPAPRPPRLVADSPASPHQASDLNSDTDNATGSDSPAATSAEAARFPDVSQLPPPAALPPSHPASPVPGTSVETVEVGRFKLKPRLTAPDAASGTPTPSLPGSALASLPPPPAAPKNLGMPVAAPNTLPVPSAKAPPFLRAPQATATPPAAGTPGKKPKPAKSNAVRIGVVAVGIGLAASVAIGGFLGLRYLMQQEKHPAAATSHTPSAASTKGAPAKAASPAGDTAVDASETTSADGGLVADPQSLPGKLIGKARDTVAARDKSGQVTDVDELTGDDAQPKFTQLARPAAAATTHTSSNQMESNADLVRQDQPKASPNPSAAFRMLVVNLRVNGVFQGEPARALMNGRMLRTGEVLDSQLGVRFTGIDAAHKLLIFEDNTGAIMQRRY